MTSPGREALRTIVLPGEGSFLARADVAQEDLARALRAHRDGRPPAVRLKANLGTVVTRVPPDGGGVTRVPPDGGAPGGAAPLDVVVKETPLSRRRRFLAALGASSRRRRDFDRARRLADLGVETPRVLACSLRPARGSEIAVTEFVAGAASLRDLLWADGAALRDDGERRRLLAAAGVWLRRLHERGVWQRDLKPGNVLAPRETSGPPRFILIDIGDVRTLSRPLDDARRARNLGQLLDLPAAHDAWAPPALVEGYLGPAEAPAAERWLAAARAARDARRDARERRSGWRTVDEEHRHVGERP